MKHLRYSWVETGWVGWVWGGNASTNLWQNVRKALFLAAVSARHNGGGCVPIAQAPTGGRDHAADVG